MATFAKFLDMDSKPIWVSPLTVTCFQAVRMNGAQVTKIYFDELNHVLVQEPPERVATTLDSHLR